MSQNSSKYLIEFISRKKKMGNTYAIFLNKSIYSHTYTNIF